MSEKPFLRVRVSRAATVPSGQDAWEKAEYSIEADVPVGSDAFNALKDLERDIEMVLAEFTERVKPSASKPTAQIPGPPTPLPPGYQPATVTSLPSAPPQPSTAQPKLPTGTTLEKVKQILKPYEGLLEFRELPKNILIFTRDWLGPNVWAEVNDLILSFPEGLWMGKEKVQDPKTLHWEIPK